VAAFSASMIFSLACDPHPTFHIAIGINSYLALITVLDRTASSTRNGI
jgi:hypothetical protein